MESITQVLASALNNNIGQKLTVELANGIYLAVHQELEKLKAPPPETAPEIPPQTN